MRVSWKSYGWNKIVSTQTYVKFSNSPNPIKKYRDILRLVNIVLIHSRNIWWIFIWLMVHCHRCCSNICFVMCETTNIFHRYVCLFTFWEYLNANVMTTLASMNRSSFWWHDSQKETIHYIRKHNVKAFPLHIINETLYSLSHKFYLICLYIFLWCEYDKNTSLSNGLIK